MNWTIKAGLVQGGWKIMFTRMRGWELCIWPPRLGSVVKGWVGNREVLDSRLGWGPRLKTGLWLLFTQIKKNREEEFLHLEAGKLNLNCGRMGKKRMGGFRWTEKSKWCFLFRGLECFFHAVSLGQEWDEGVTSYYWWALVTLWWLLHFVAFSGTSLYI